PPDPRTRARNGAFDQVLRALGRFAEGPLGPDIGEALRGAGPELGRRLVAAALAGQPHPGAPHDDGGDEVIARRAVALRLAAMAGAQGVVEAAVPALAEDLLAEPAQRALVTLGAPALTAMFERLADASVPPEARATLVDVIADVLDASTSRS